NRQVGAGDSLGDGNDVGGDVVVLVGKHLAGAAEAVDHLIDVQKDVVLPAQLLDLGQILVWWHGDAHAAHDRFDDHLGDRFRSFAQDRGLDVLHTGEAATRIGQTERAAIAI